MTEIEDHLEYVNNLDISGAKKIIALNLINVGSATEQELMDITGYSRNPIRDAVSMLKDEGLVRTRPDPRRITDSGRTPHRHYFSEDDEVNIITDDGRDDFYYYRNKTIFALAEYHYCKGVSTATCGQLSGKLGISSAEMRGILGKMLDEGNPPVECINMSNNRYRLVDVSDYSPYRV